jgi:hypothetical protein
MWITTLVIHIVIHRQNGLISGKNGVFHIIHRPYYYYYLNIPEYTIRARARGKKILQRLEISKNVDNFSTRFMWR